MKKTKRRAAVISALILTALLAADLVGFAGCTSGDKPADATTAASTAETTETLTSQTSESTTAQTTTAATTKATAAATTAPVKRVGADGEVMGEGIGVNPGRVSWVYDPESVDWDGSGFWWNPKNFDEERVIAMVEDGIKALAGEKDVKAAWDALFKYHNTLRGRGGKGYVKGEKISIKINMNAVSNAKGQTNASFTSPLMLKALLTSLIEDAGVPAEDITVFDASRVIPDHMLATCGGGVREKVNFKFWSSDKKYDCEMDMNAPIVWSEKIDGETSYIPTCVTGAAYMINFASLKGHSLAGVTLTAKNHFGTLMNSSRNNPPQAAGIHGYVTAHPFNSGVNWVWPTRPMGTYNVLTDFIASKYLGQRTFLYILDALFVAKTQGAQMDKNSKWQTFGGDWPSSMFFSQDPVAIDTVGADFLMNEPTITVITKDTTLQNYLHESAMAENPPSGTKYKDGAGGPAGNLGVHEHWNNPSDKQYSRDLGHDWGIGLYRVTYGK